MRRTSEETLRIGSWQGGGALVSVLSGLRLQEPSVRGFVLTVEQPGERCAAAVPQAFFFPFFFNGLAVFHQRCQNNWTDGETRPETAALLLHHEFCASGALKKIVEKNQQNYYRKQEKIQFWRA